MDFNHWNVIWSCLFGFLAVLVTAGNGFTILIFSRSTVIFRTRCYNLLISLAVADLLVGSLAVPLYMAANNSKLKMAKPFQCIDMFSGLSSIFTLAAISLERMFTVVFPVRHRALSSRAHIYAIASTWVIVGVANGLSKMLSLGKFTPSLGISALKNSVSESRISRNMTVSESQILKIWISESRILKIWISKSRQWDFNFLSASLSETRN